MAELLVYLETSVWSHLFHDETPDFQRATVELLARAAAGSFEPMISTVVLDEVSRASTERREQLLNAIAEHSPAVLRVTPEVTTLAERYVGAGVLPRREFVDALHVAVATVYELDVLVSWNQRHLANLRRRDLFNSVNVIAGYRKPIDIVNPLEISNE